MVGKLLMWKCIMVSRCRPRGSYETFTATQFLSLKIRKRARAPTLLNVRASWVCGRSGFANGINWRLVPIYRWCGFVDKADLPAEIEFQIRRAFGWAGLFPLPDYDIAKLLSPWGAVSAVTDKCQHSKKGKQRAGTCMSPPGNGLVCIWWATFR